MDEENHIEMTFIRKTAITRQKLQPRYWPAENSQWQRRIFDQQGDIKTPKDEKTSHCHKPFQLLRIQQSNN